MTGSIEVLSEQSSGRQRRMVVRGFDQAAKELLEARPGVLSVRSRPASLEEVFIACTRGSVAAAVDDDRFGRTGQGSDGLQPSVRGGSHES